MAATSRFPRSVGPLLSAAAVVIIIVGLRAAAPILRPLLLALFLAIISLPLLEWLRARGVRLSLAISATILADIAVILALVLMVSGTVNAFAVAAPGYLDGLYLKATTALASLEERGISASDWLVLEPMAPQAVMGVIGGILGGTVKGVASAFSFFLLVVVTMICVMAEAVGFRAKLGAAFGGREAALEHLSAITKEVQRYLGVKTLTSAATGLIVAVWVTVLGVDFPVLWGLVAFLLNYIPVIGSIIAAVPPVIVGLVQYGFGRALLVAAGYVAVNVVIGNLVEPYLMGKRFGLSTLVVFLSMVFWGWVFGPLGMILSVPLTMVIKIALNHTESMKWLAVLLGPSPPPAPSPVPVAGGDAGS